MSVPEWFVAELRPLLRINHDMYDAEISGLVEEAQADLKIGGILETKAEDVKDALIRKALRTYVKAEFGLDNADAEEYRAAYQAIRTRLMLSSEYSKE